MGNSVSRESASETIDKFPHFDEEDIKMWILQFETIFPAGYATLDDMEFVLTILFPFGQSKKFAKILFRNINLTENSKIDLSELLISFSILVCGSDYEKIRWIYRLFDLNGNGIITKKDMMEVFYAYHEMLGGMFGNFDENFVENIFVNLKNKKDEESLNFDEFKTLIEKENLLLFFNSF